MELSTNVIIAAIMSLVAVALFLYLVRKPLNIQVRFREMYSSKPKRQSPKFRNDAPIAPDMLFENDSHSLPTLKNMPKFETVQSKVEPSPLQHDVSQILWYLKQASTVYLDEKDMEVFVSGKRIAIVRCLEEKRVQVWHVENLISLAKKLRVKMMYLVIMGKLDRPAAKLVIHSKIKIIDTERLDTLRSRIANIPKK